MKHVYLGRQPIVDKSESLHFYELLYRDGVHEQNTDRGRYASASVINSVLNKFGTEALLGTRKGFVKIDEKFLMGDLIFSVPEDFFVFSILSDIELNERVIERVQQLNAKGYSVGLNDVVLNKETLEKYTPILNELSFVKVVIGKDVSIKTKEMINFLQSKSIQVVATHVETHIGFDTAQRFGCDLFQGYFFAKPKILENSTVDPSQLNVLRLYNMLMQDTNIDEITDEFEKNHALTLQLLRFINSCAFHFRNKISSIHHILTLVGRKPLAQWLMMMIYSKSVAKTYEVSPLMLMVKNRTELMQNILKALKPDVKTNALGEAYFVGVLSLASSVFNQKLEDIIASINVSDIAKNALLDDEGTLGKIYVLVREIESFNTQAIENFSKRYKLDLGSLQEIINKSMENVNLFEKEMGASI